MNLTPLIVGSGLAGEAIAKSFACLNVIHSDFEIQPAIWLKRGEPLAAAKDRYENPVLCIANPHGLHADLIHEGEKAGFTAILCEKPSCVSLDQLRRLQAITTPTAVLHVYRQMWGVQTLKSMLASGELGDLICIEGRYWQSSTAERALGLNGNRTKDTWKNDPRLSGDSDTFLDLGSHWLDAVSFLFGSAPTRVDGWRSFVNADTSHRDSHVQISSIFPQGQRAMASISKTVHGAANHFELNLIGSKKSATWEFLKPDMIELGEGRDRRIVTRKNSEFGSKQPPHHGMGWLEGYLEICHALIADAFLGQSSSYPRLKENLPVLKSMFKVQWQGE